MESKILLTNYPRIKQYAQFENVDTKKRLDIVVGYDIDLDSKIITEQIASDLITAILSYDKIYIEGTHISDIIQVWGSNYLKELLRLNIIQVIPDQTLNPSIINENNAFKVGFFPYTQGYIKNKESLKQFNPHKWSHIESEFLRKNFYGQEANAILYLIDENSVNLNENEIAQWIKKETNLDLTNVSLLKQYGLVDPLLSKPIDIDYPKILRIHELNKAGVLASIIGVDSIKTDGEINNLLALKTLSEFDKTHTNGIDALNKVSYEKGFPNLGKLFVNETIGLDHILKLRDSFQGKIFRYWLQTSEYEEILMRKEIMNSVHNVLGNRISNTVRMIGTSLIGVAGFLPGVLSSSFDSFVLEKISKGWHPNFFLDDKLKAMIDKSISTKEDERKSKLAQERFKGVGRNEPCPCGSAKKFKKCHGKNI